MSKKPAMEMEHSMPMHAGAETETPGPADTSTSRPMSSELHHPLSPLRGRQDQRG